MKNKYWIRMYGMDQWRSVNHPDFLYVSVFNNFVFRRLGNASFILMGTKPEVLYEARNHKDALQFARKWVSCHNDTLSDIKRDKAF